MRAERSDVSIGLERLAEMEKKEGYLRFLNSINPSLSATYWNPASINSVASLTFDAVLHVYSSFSSYVISWVYSIVVSIFLCPSRCMTNSMSFVLSYSCVAW